MWNGFGLWFRAGAVPIKKRPIDCFPKRKLRIWYHESRQVSMGRYVF